MQQRWTCPQTDRMLQAARTPELCPQRRTLLKRLTKRMNLTEQLSAFATLGATWVMWLLVALSVVGLAIIFERTLFLLGSRDNFDSLRRDLIGRLDAADEEGARKRLESSRSPEARIAERALQRVEDGEESARQRVEGETQLQKLRMERYLAFLGTVGNNAPFIGLLGTVIGIIRAFRELESSAGQVSTGLMSEIGEALVATAIGLLVALPAVAFFNLFQRVIRARTSRASALASEVIAYLSAPRRPKAGIEAAEAKS